MVVFTFLTEGTDRRANTSYLIIPHATLSAQIRMAELSSSGPADLNSGTDDTQMDPGPPAPVPWNDWGLHGCLSLRTQPKRHHIIREVPFGSRMPLVVFEGPDFKRASVYVFDVNPLVARYARLQAHDCQTTTVVEDVEAVLPGIVDPRCAAVPYVVYRFELPFASVRPYEHSIQSVEMKMTGFTVTVSMSGLYSLFELRSTDGPGQRDDVRFEGNVQTWTV